MIRMFVNIGDIASWDIIGNFGRLYFTETSAGIYLQSISDDKGTSFMDNWEAIKFFAEEEINWELAHRAPAFLSWTFLLICKGRVQNKSLFIGWGKVNYQGGYWNSIFMVVFVCVNNVRWVLSWLGCVWWMVVRMVSSILIVACLVNSIYLVLVSKVNSIFMVVCVCGEWIVSWWWCVYGK